MTVRLTGKISLVSIGNILWEKFLRLGCEYQILSLHTEFVVETKLSKSSRALPIVEHSLSTVLIYDLNPFGRDITQCIPTCTYSLKKLCVTWLATLRLISWLWHQHSYFYPA
jgi:hypothetical protein